MNSCDGSMVPAQVEVEIEVPAETMESVAIEVIEVSWSLVFRELRGEAPHISTLAGTAEEHSLEVQRASLWLCGIPNKDREFKDLPDAHI